MGQQGTSQKLQLTKQLELSGGKGGWEIRLRAGRGQVEGLLPQGEEPRAQGRWTGFRQGDEVSDNWNGCPACSREDRQEKGRTSVLAPGLWPPVSFLDLSQLHSALQGVTPETAFPILTSAGFPPGLSTGKPQRVIGRWAEERALLSHQLCWQVASVCSIVALMPPWPQLLLQGPVRPTSSPAPHLDPLPQSW